MVAYVGKYQKRCFKASLENIRPISDAPPKPLFYTCKPNFSPCPADTFGLSPGELNFLASAGGRPHLPRRGTFRE